jgi:hypothetical protein
VKKVARAKRYADDTRSYSTNEVCINWNSPLVWTTAWLDARLNPESDAKTASGGLSPALVAVIIAVAVALAGVVGALLVSRRRTGK